MIEINAYGECKHGIKVSSCATCCPELLSVAAPRKYREPALLTTEVLADEEFCDSYTLGYLAGNMKMTVDVPVEKVDYFHNQYASVTDFPLNEKHVHWLPETANKWGISSRIEFDDDANLSFSHDIEVVTDSNGKKYISNNKFMWYLLNAGFNYGREDHNVDVICESADNYDLFEEGFCNA